MAEVITNHYFRLVDWLGKHTNKKLIISCGLTVILVRLAREWYLSNRLKQRLLRKQKQLEERMRSFRTHVETTETDEIELLGLTDLTMTELREKLAKGELTPSRVLHAFQLKALKLYDSGNSGICEFISKSKELTVALENSDPSSPLRSPLYGIPVSLKESIPVKGYDSTLGLIKRCNAPNRQDSVLVEVLMKVGAIPFVLTSTSQACLTLHGDNVIFGTVTNPLKSSRVPGGSSTGEAILLSQRGSPLGFGVDTAGSIRIPAAFCGLASLKPTSRRLSSLGLVSISERSLVGLQACPGPMAKKVDDLADAMRALLCPTLFSLDYEVLPLPFNESAYKKDGPVLSIGYYDDIADPGVIHTCGVVQDTICHAADVLRHAGHRLVRFQPPKPVEAFRLLLRLLFADGGKELRTWLAREPLETQLRFTVFILNLPNWIKISTDIFLMFIGARPAAVAHTMGGARNAQNVIDMLAAVRRYRIEFQRAWNEAGPLDALVCPVSPYPAPPASASSLFVSVSIIYAALYNLLDYPAGTISTYIMDEVDAKSNTSTIVNKRLAGEWYESRVAMMQQDATNLPVAVQVVGKPYCEETVLRVMRILEEVTSG